MSHEFFVGLSYGISFFLIAALTLWIVVGMRRAKAKLDALEAKAPTTHDAPG